MPVSHALASDIFSLNFYMYPWPWPESGYHTITLAENDQEAGVDDWLTNGWQDIEIPWAPPGPQDPLEITSKQGATATYTLVTARNGGAYIWDNIRTTLIGDGNADLMDGHANGTEDADELIDFTVSDIPFDVYDVIIYMGSQLAQFGDGTGKLTFNGVAHDFTLISGGFDGTFAEIVNPDTPGNYFLFTGLKDSSFTVVTRGNGFNHSGPTGLQIRKASPELASAASPESEQIDVLRDTVLNWTPGLYAATHDVYLGETLDAVDTATVPTAAGLAEASFDPGRLEFGQTYYWRVDEVNDAEVPSVWAGPVWSLSTADALVVDDFDGYNNVSPDRPFQTWHDGIGYSADDFFPVAYGGNGTGAAIGHDVWSLSSPYYDGAIMEKLITMEGSDQSMPFYYDNSTASGSETTANIADLEVGHDWSQSGIQYLTLSFRADSLSEALDTTASFTAGDTVGWYSQDVIAQDGEDAAQNLDVADGESAMMRTTVTGAGTVSFQWKVSSEADWDFLEFYIDGAMQEQISGEVAWQQMTYEITGAGDHVLEWVYVKDGAVSSGQDVGWVDGLQWSGGGLPITAPGNTGQLYAKVNSVRVDYPGSVAGVKWASWQIDLAALGTNLQNVQTLTIGIDGAGVSGLLYLDNFRLESGQ